MTVWVVKLDLGGVPYTMAVINEKTILVPMPDGGLSAQSKMFQTLEEAQSFLDDEMEKNPTLEKLEPFEFIECEVLH